MTSLNVSVGTLLGVDDPISQVALADAFELERRKTVGTAHADGVGREFEEHLSGKRVVPRVQWLESRRDVVKVVTRARPLKAMSIAR